MVSIQDHTVKKWRFIPICAGPQLTHPNTSHPPWPGPPSTRLAPPPTRLGCPATHLRQVVVFCQIEDMEGVKNMEEIVKVPVRLMG